MPEDKLATVRKLLAKADSLGIATQEANSFIDKAADLMADYGIDAADLLAADPASDVITARWYPICPPFAREVALLLNAVACPFGAKAFWTHDAETDAAEASYHVHLIAYVKDLERVDVMFPSVTNQAAAGLMAACEARKAAGKPVTPKVQRDWLKGFAAGVFQQLGGAQERAEARRSTGKPGTAIVLRDRKSSVDAAYAAEHPDARPGSETRIGSDGGADGFRAGKAADLGQGNALGNTRRALT